MNTDEYLIKVKCFGGKGLDLYYAGLGQLVASPFSQMDQWFTVVFFKDRITFCHAHLHPSPAGVCIHVCECVCICVCVCVYVHGCMFVLSV